MTVLIVAGERDRSANGVVRALDARGVDVARIDTGWFPQRLTLDAEFADGHWVGELRTGSRAVALENVRAVWYRSPATFTLPDGMSPAERQYARREGKLGLGGVLTALPVLAVNDPHSAARAVYKPLQLAVAAGCGLAVPDTQITNRAEAVRRFAAAAGHGGIVTKALGTTLVYEEDHYKLGRTHRGCRSRDERPAGRAVRMDRVVAQRAGPAGEPTRTPFSEELGHLITPVDIGLEETDQHKVGLRYCESIAATVVAVAELGRYDMRRRGFLHKATFLVVAAVAPSRDWLLAVLDATERRPGGRIGMAQVGTIRDTFAVFQEADVLHGGGHARAALAEYVTGRVLPLLHDADPQSEAGAALFAAASEQIYLLGWTAIDDDCQALAQRYLIQALRLAQESGDTALGAHVLAGMSHQALMLGYPREALQLATAGRHGLTRAYSPACASRLFALQAGAHAALGDTTAAVRAVVESERAFERIDTDAEPEWARFIDNAYLSGEWASTFADLQRPVESTRFARRSIAEASQHSRARREVFSQAALARAALTRKDLETALRAAHRAVDLSTMVQSSRSIAAVRDLQTRISPYRTLAPAREFDDHAREARTRASLN